MDKNLALLATTCLIFTLVPTQPVANGPVINPTLCIGFTAFIIGTAIGIGIGVLITNNRYRNGFGGGLWFGRRKKRSLEFDQMMLEDESSFHVLNAIDKAQNIYEEDQ